MKFNLTEQVLQHIVLILVIYCATVHLIRAIRDVLIERQTTKVKIATLQFKTTEKTHGATG